MRIDEASAPDRRVPFGTLKPGDVFLCSSWYVRCALPGAAVRLGDGTIVQAFGSGDLVLPDPNGAYRPGVRP